MTSQGRTIHLRLQIAGLDVEPVTSPLLESGAKIATESDEILQTESGSDLVTEAFKINEKERVRGLQFEGISREEKVDPHLAEMEGEPIEFKVVERQHDKRFTQAFWQKPTLVRYLTSEMSTSDTTMQLTDTSGISEGDILHINTECVQVDSVDSSTQLTVTRAKRDTKAQKHFTEDGEKKRRPEVTDKPSTIEGRRTKLFRYVEGTHDLSGSGDQIWFGRLTTDVRLSSDGGTWVLTVDPNTTAMDQPMGVDIDEPVSPRGIYYPWTNPLFLDASERTGSNFGDDIETNPKPEMVTGFFETQEDFINGSGGLQAKLDNLFSGLEADAFAYPDGESWRVEISIGSNAKYVAIILRSACDGASGTLPRDRDTGEEVSSVGSSSIVYLKAGDRVAEGSPITNTVGLGAVPRGAFGPNVVPAEADVELLTPSTRSAAPKNRIHLSGSVGLSTDMRFFTVPDSIARPISSVSSSDRWIEAEFSNDTIVFTPEQMGITGRAKPTSQGKPELKFAREISVRNDFGQAIKDLTNLAPDFMNIGGFPDITSEDVDTATWISVIDEAHGGREFLSDRVFLQAGEVDFSDWLKHHCRLYGVVPHMASDGKLTVSHLRLPSNTEPTDHDLTDDDDINDDGWEVPERNRAGSINTLTFKTEWNPWEQAHEGLTVRVVDVAAFGKRKNPKALEVAPTSESSSGERPPFDELREIAFKVTGIFGQDYYVVELPIPYTRDDIEIMDIVSLELENLPNHIDGTRGVSKDDVRGIVVGRRFDDDRASGRLRILYPGALLFGYTPSGHITGQTDNGSNNWTLDVSQTEPFSSKSMAQNTQALTDQWNTGDQIRILETENASPTIVHGEITAIDDSASTIDVSLDSSWTPGSKTWVLIYDKATDISDSYQKRHVFQSGSDGRVDFSGETVDGREFA